MTNGNDIAEYEEQNYDDLAEMFIKDNQGRWDCFVEEMYNQHNAELL